MLQMQGRSHDNAEVACCRVPNDEDAFGSLGVAWTGRERIARAGLLGVAPSVQLTTLAIPCLDQLGRPKRGTAGDDSPTGPPETEPYAQSLRLIFKNSLPVFDVLPRQCVLDFASDRDRAVHKRPHQQRLLVSARNNERECHDTRDDQQEVRAQEAQYVEV
jgi:hypothetical protein